MSRGKGRRPYSPERRAEVQLERETAGATLRERRRAVGWTQADLATACGVTSHAVGCWERGSVMVPADAWEAFELGLTTMDLAVLEVGEP